MELNVEIQESSGKKPSLFGIIISPSLQFERLKTSKGLWGVLFLVSIMHGFVNGLNTYVTQQSPEFLKLQENIPVGMQESVSIQMIKAVVQGSIGAAIGFLFVTIVYKTFMIFLGNDTSYSKLLTIIIYADIILLLGVFINVILALIFNGDGLVSYISLAPLFESGTTIYGIANMADFFYIWNLFLIWMGLCITASLSKRKALIPIIFIFVFKSVFISTMISFFNQFSSH
ncbi:hypothetical protein COO04_13825 [Bacillus toyonensis]|uniref:Yip1 family protein n=2 Tax=Bacillus toyonensis TaxID=155322 RepID=UPI000BED7888|nr:Yip1 family protein [Bacillus toyonensis]PEG15630.1 hypothetical protein COO04_13825 [Bacillus toyonensis]